MDTPQECVDTFAGAMEETAEIATAVVSAVQLERLQPGILEERGYTGFVREEGTSLAAQLFADLNTDTGRYLSAGVFSRALEDITNNDGRIAESNYSSFVEAVQGGATAQINVYRDQAIKICPTIGTEEAQPVH